MNVQKAQEQITQAVLEWGAVIVQPHRFGGVEYVMGKREIGHIRGNHMIDIPFPKKVRDQLIAEGNAQPHHLLAESGWVSFYINEPHDILRAVALLRQSFEIAVRQKQPRPSS